MSSSQPGLGVMIQMLGENEESVNALKGAIGKKITKAELNGDYIKIWFGKKGIQIWDGGQSCCEHRYITTDDSPADLVGKKLTNIEIAAAPVVEGDAECHEVQFLRIHAEDETVVFETHNEHNGFYGGFWIQIEEI